MTKLSPFVKLAAQGRRLPILLSAPHVGTVIPLEIQRQMNPNAYQNLLDTDWLIDELYGFAPQLGITLIAATYSRYVVDLNRPSEGAPLYQDARRQTEVIPSTSFNGDPLYSDNFQLTAAEKQSRLESYYYPYHRVLTEELKLLREEFPHVLLFDAHSIRRSVPSLHPDPFPDMIVGDRDGTSAGLDLALVLRKHLQKSGVYRVTQNDPFKGGHITRNFGKVEAGVHALQLEMSQDIYFDDVERKLDVQKAPGVQEILKSSLLALAKVLTEASA